MLFSSRKDNISQIDIIFDNTQVTRESYHRHLGIVFSENLTWKNHVDYIFTKIARRMNVLKSIQRRVPRACLENIYECMILPIIEYADVVYDNLSKQLSNELEKIQRQAALACTGAYRHTQHQAILRELGWIPLDLRRRCHRLNLFYKILNNKTPNYIKSILPRTVFERTNYNLRNRENLTVPQFRKKLCYNSFLPKTIRDWNELPLIIRQSTTYDTFKTNIKQKFYINKNKLFKYTSGPASIHICRMRLGLSGLNMHRFLYNFIDTPKCLLCGASIEDSVHFFLLCPRYAAQRNILLAQLAPLLSLEMRYNDILTSNVSQREFVKYVLNGLESFTLPQNIEIFKQVQQFINDTKRFA